jgi:hypothetical protein
MLAASVYFAATTPNLVANTDIQSAPEDGVLLLQIVATQVDWTFSVSAGNDTPIRNQKVPFKAAATVNQNDDPVTTLPVLAGQQIVVQCTVVTGGFGAVLARFVGESEL